MGCLVSYHVSYWLRSQGDVLPGWKCALLTSVWVVCHVFAVPVSVPSFPSNLLPDVPVACRLYRVERGVRNRNTRRRRIDTVSKLLSRDIRGCDRMRDLGRSLGQGKAGCGCT